MMGRNLGTVLPIALALLLPTSVAEAVSGSLSIESARLPPGAGTTLRPDAALLRETDQVDTFAVASPRLRVTYHEMQFVSPPVPNAPAVQTGASSRSFFLTSATVAKTSDGDHDGHVGFYPESPATLVLTGVEETIGRPSVLTTIEGDGDWTPDTAGLWWYSQRVEGPHVHYAGAGALHYRGPGAFKVYGLDVAIRGSGNATPETFRTGLFQDDTAHYRQAWLILEADDATLDAAGTAPVEMASKTAGRLRWEGAAIVAGARGDLEAGGEAYAARGEQASLSGELTADLVPAGRSATLRLEGELDRTSLSAATTVRSPAGPAPSEIGSGLVGLGLGAVVAGGIAWGWSRRIRHATEAARLDHCMEMADQATLLGMHRTAADWLREARRYAPANAGLALDEAAALEALGEDEAALVAYAEAHTLSRSGAAALARARLLARLDRPLAEIREWAGFAIARSPDMVADLRSEPFARLQADPRWRRAVAAAEREDARRGPGDRP